MPVAESGNNTRVVPPRMRFLGPVPEYGTDRGLKGPQWPKPLRWRGEKIEKVCDRVSQEWSRAS